MQVSISSALEGSIRQQLWALQARQACFQGIFTDYASVLQKYQGLKAGYLSLMLFTGWNPLESLFLSRHFMKTQAEGREAEKESSDLRFRIAALQEEVKDAKEAKALSAQVSSCPPPAPPAPSLPSCFPRKMPSIQACTMCTAFALCILLQAPSRGTDVRTIFIWHT